MSVETDKGRRAGRLASGGAIREAAATLFLEKGYAGTSMDDIAAAAQVSKQTIYTHFSSKEQLFADLVLGNAQRVEDFIATLERTLTGADDVEKALRQVARMYLRLVMRPEVLRLRRLVVGEAARFPDLARTYYEQVPGRVYEALERIFRDLASSRRLRVDDPGRAAEHFAWLTLGLPLDRGMFYPPDALTSDEELDRIADAAVQVFFSAYGRSR